MFKREGRFDGQLRGFKSRERRALYCSDDFSLSSFFFLSPQPIGFSFFPSLALSLIETRREKERIKYMKKIIINRNRSRADARTHSNLSNSRVIELEIYSRVQTSVDRSTPTLARRVEYAHEVSKLFFSVTYICFCAIWHFLFFAFTIGREKI